MSEHVPKKDADSLLFETVEVIWKSNVAQVIPLGESSIVQLRVDPPSKTFALRVPFEGRLPSLKKYRNVNVVGRIISEVEMLDLEVNINDNLREAFGLISSVVGKAGGSGSSWVTAIEESINAHHELISLRSRMSHNHEIGLFGELMFFTFLARSRGAKFALGAWKGPRSGEHDFVFDEKQFEVKTTSSERRTHIIGGLTQLVPAAEGQLFLVSIQITEGSSETGKTLSEFIQSVLSEHSEHKSAITRMLEEAGWSHQDADLYLTKWAMRTLPKAYLVDSAFPAITPERLALAVPQNNYISTVQYSLDVTNLKSTKLSSWIDKFLEP